MRRRSTRTRPGPSRCAGTDRASPRQEPPLLHRPYCFLLTPSSVDRVVALDSFLGIELNDWRHKHSLLVRASRVDGERLSDLYGPFALVNVAVQGNERLVAFDRLAHRGGTHRSERSSTVKQPQVRVDRGRLVETGLEGRAVEVEDGLGGIGEPARHLPDSLPELSLGFLSVSVPRRVVGPPSCHHRPTLTL